MNPVHNKIDIKGAFESIQYNAIESYLDNRKCPTNIVNVFKNLLRNRLNTIEGLTIRNQKQSFSQGSCSGTAIEILQENWPINTNTQIFTNDFVLVSHAPTRDTN
ncbi:hypothetical protein AVEN_150544-1 [Araneus ventricosus]|uniref:Reverse transcriptase domain-containing protein n=1 Tax=Araneus ventricosus TaxID=182803 RepID=A0A4Y2E2D9_ARAVE|nr:hypothetical protein AVEN_150544-1 [Araneus ventricosus]